jgi:excinuclease ABC subunit B
MITTSVAGEDIEENVSASDKINFNEMTKVEKEMILLDLRKEMIELAENLEFEKAAQLRDEIVNIENNIGLVVT